MVVHGASWLFMVVHGGGWWLMVVDGGYGGGWWLMVVHGGSWWFMVVDGPLVGAMAGPRVELAAAAPHLLQTSLDNSLELISETPKRQDPVRRITANVNTGGHLASLSEHLPSGHSGVGHSI
uniref:Secreted protein n=1 Tax=Knipowitschia caucasica TaxID=637954 RepID=A0AAV2MEU7_KNICA